MKLVDHFRTFLVDTVNINDTRLEQLESNVKAIESFIEDSGWKPPLRSFKRQGSWAHRTIIKPVDGNPFDADLLVTVDPVEGWTAKQYISSLRSLFANSGTYEAKVKSSSHCITIEYAGDRRVDIAPCVVGRLYATSHEVCNANEDAFQPSEPAAYTAFLNDRDSWTGNNGLRKVTRLVKYLRDIKRTFTCPSFLLTTLLGCRISEADETNDADFVDVPTALRTITARLDDWLQVRPTKPSVLNPVLSSEVISDLWTDEQYENFREKIHRYREWIDDAYAEEDKDESIGKWRRVFGDDFAKSVALDKAARVSEAGMVLAHGGMVHGSEDLVTRFMRLGEGALPTGFDRLPHKHRPTWRRATSNTFNVRLIASLHREHAGARLGAAQSGEAIEKGRSLRFEVQTADGLPLGGDFEVQWRVTNTDQEAYRAGQLRGQFQDSAEGRIRWESTKYRGVHSVEAFVLRRRDRILMAQSKPFYVVIK